MSTFPSRKAAGILVAIVAIVLVLVLLLTPMVQTAFFDLFLSPFQKRVPASVTFEVERDIIVEANGGSIINFTLDIPAILDMDASEGSMQSVLNVSYDPEPSSLSPRYGVDWAVWNQCELSGEESLRVKVTYEIRVETVIWDLDSTLSANVTEIPEDLTDQYLRDEWKIIVTDPRIEATAEGIVKGETNVYSILSAINAWMIEHVGYPSESGNADPASSLQTLDSMIGDCDDQAILFCALARASGVPAWLQLGAMYDKTEHEWVGHGWVQTYVPLREGGGENVTIDTVNRDFMIWKANRFVEYTDDGNHEHLYDYYYSFNCAYEPDSYQSGEGPEYSEEYVSLSYSESAEKIRIDGSLQFCLEALLDVELASVKRL